MKIRRRNAKSTGSLMRPEDIRRPESVDTHGSSEMNTEHKYVWASLVRMLKLFSQNTTHNRKLYVRKLFSSLCRGEKIMLAGLTSLCIPGNIQTQPWACAQPYSRHAKNSLPVRWALSGRLDTLPRPSGLRNVVKDRNVFRIEEEEEEEGRSFWKNNTGKPELVVTCAPVAVNGQKNQQLHSGPSRDGCVTGCSRPFSAQHIQASFIGPMGKLALQTRFCSKNSKTVVHTQDSRALQ